MQSTRASIRFGALLFACAIAGIVACAGHQALTPVGPSSGDTSAQTPLGRLNVRIVLISPALHATALTLYAYPLPSSGPLATPPPSARTRIFDVSPRSTHCKTASAARTCTFFMRVEPGPVAVAATLATGKTTTAQAFAERDVTPALLALVAGKVSIAQLTLLAPQLRRPAFNVAVTALQTESADGTSPVVMIDPRKLPVVVHVYAPSGVVPSPQATVGGSGVTASFRYAGTRVDNAMTVTAVAGTASMTAQIFPRNSPPQACKPLGETDAFDVSEAHGLLDGFYIHASVAGSTPILVQLDTGSTTFLISKSKLTGAQQSQLIGPGQFATETLEPSGDILSGNYYLAPVTLSSTSQTIGTTVPMEVLVVTKACNKTGSCSAGSTAYMGIGFGRPSPEPTQFLLKTPTENAFLQLQDVVTGTMHPGFILTPTSLAIGINSTNAAGFAFAQLQPFSGRPGDWNSPPACLQFNGGAYQCGSMLLDIGIHSMFIAAPTPQPLNSIHIVAPTANQQLLDYTFPYPVTSGATPPAPDPSASPPIAFQSPGPSPFVNTGRYALAAADYLYDSGCGRVGFDSHG